ncbi:O-antigen ligase family protein, partial [Patescibacteria group bacterium]|nr:O-antigen ligase family protein [Patescibacteria group bacterium]
GLIFNDANNYFYFALIFPVYGVLRSRKIVERLHYVITAAILFLALKTIALFYIFSHEFFYLQDVLYSWLRATRLAEITNIDPNILLSRIFMQSQIWLVFLLFVYLALFFKSKSRIAVFLVLLTLPMSAIIISFSRSFWLAWIIAFLVFAGFYFVSRFKKGLKEFFIFIGLTCAVVLASVGLTLAVASFPIPKGVASADLLRNRAARFTGEAAVSSRYSQIRPLLESIKNHPAIGSGFGTSVTYESQDPRVLKNNPDGKYTTTAFELGWLEVWLKLGLIGVLAYLYLLYKICKIGYERINRIASVEIKKYALVGLCVGLIAVALTHGVSPYLNHPLGIGIVIISASLVDRKHI